MKLISQDTLLKELRRHIPAKHYDFSNKNVEPYLKVYRTDSSTHLRQYRFFDEETYNMVVNTAIRARKANPSSLESAENDFCSLIKAINKPSVETIYTLQDAADQTGKNPVSSYQFLSTTHCKPFDFLDTNGTRVKFMDYENYLKAIDFVKQNGPKAHKTKQEPKKADNKPIANQQLPVRHAQPSYVHVSINSLTFNLTKQDALKLAQSIIDQIGG